MIFKVVVADAIDKEGLDLLEADEDFEIISVVGDADKLSQTMEGAHALLVRSSTQVTSELMEKAPQLRVVGRAGIGIDNIDVDAATRRGVAVVNAPGANTVSAAEHTIALLLAVVRRVPWAAASMAEGKWDRKKFAGTELRGKTLGLIGLGRIGAHVAKIARAFGMDVLAFDPFLSADRARDLGVDLGKLEEVLEKADVISLHAPSTDSTHHIIDRKALALVKPTAVLVNTARGSLIDDEALAEAVKNGKLAGAALDVFDPEPLPDDSPLRGVDGILLTPHLAASTQEAQTRVSVEICQTVREVLLTGDIGSAVNVPGVSGDVLTRSAEGLSLAREVGCLAGSLASGRVESIEVDFGSSDDAAAKAFMLSAVEGVLRSIGIGPVSLVNAGLLAEERSITVSRRVGRPKAGYETTVGVRIQTSQRSTEVVGAMVGPHQRRVIRIDEYAVDIPPGGNVLILKNKDVPGVIGKVGTVLGAANVNIGFYHQSRKANNGNEALAAISVDHAPGAKVLEELKMMEDVIDVRYVGLATAGEPGRGDLV